MNANFSLFFAFIKQNTTENSQGNINHLGHYIISWISSFLMFVCVGSFVLSNYAHFFYGLAGFCTLIRSFSYGVFTMKELSPWIHCKNVIRIWKVMAEEEKKICRKSKAFELFESWEKGNELIGFLVNSLHYSSQSAGHDYFTPIKVSKVFLLFCLKKKKKIHFISMNECEADS